MKILTLRISLVDSKPEIWRRFQISDEMTLDDLHDTIQIVMGWTDSHLHDFEINKRRYSKLLKNDDLFGEPCINEDETVIGSVLKRKRQKFEYIYDMGDYWQHKLIVEDITDTMSGQYYPVCLEGENACPPEDCGGTWGYYQMLKTLSNPNDEEYVFMRELIGGDFDPKAFDMKEVNEVLADFDEYESGWDLEDE